MPTSADQKRPLSVWQMFNMSFGCLDIQLDWGLQLANMSTVYEQLGARPDRVSPVWLVGLRPTPARRGTW